MPEKYDLTAKVQPFLDEQLFELINLFNQGAQPLTDKSGEAITDFSGLSLEDAEKMFSEESIIGIKMCSHACGEVIGIPKIWQVLIAASFLTLSSSSLSNLNKAYNNIEGVFDWNKTAIQRTEYILHSSGASSLANWRSKSVSSVFNNSFDLD
ncbi:hypothetical protein FF38_13412 [Lucilia cuprina]|uniref:Uncharacterized protein n=1 Tax=Lucilia cuprina TaxID=7375 RepID=A0A0L0CC29_LUCCU|nr:hypothetical protein FF38_13412 [Lucilia cuprina]